MTPAEVFAQAWDILVEHAGNRDDPANKETFIRYYLDDKFPGTEWRFQGDLGFGGKFWRDINHYRISYYSEDRTADRDAIVEKVNLLLKKLPYFYPSKDIP